MFYANWFIETPKFCDFFIVPRNAHLTPSLPFLIYHIINKLHELVYLQYLWQIIVVDTSRDVKTSKYA